MTQLARVVLRVFVTVVLVASGAYVVIYLYRWEWNRAFVSGLFFLAALISMTTTMLMRSLRDLSDRIDRLETQTRSLDRTAQTIRTTNASNASRHFEWLREPPDGLGVFVPLLLGAGVVLSAVAYVVERLAGAVAGPTADRATAHLLAPDLPPGLSGVAAAPGGQPHRHTEPPRNRRGLKLMGAGAAVAILIGSILVLREATQWSEEPGSEDGTTLVRLRISQRGGSQPAEEVAEALWIACQNRLPDAASVGEIIQLDADTVNMVIDQGMGQHRRRRFFGCLEDATLDHVMGHVESFDIQREADRPPNAQDLRL